jgi:hypothetical protein
VPVTRETVVKELPVYINRRQPEQQWKRGLVSRDVADAALAAARAQEPS